MKEKNKVKEGKIKFTFEQLFLDDAGKLSLTRKKKKSFPLLLLGLGIII